jgi:sucrose-6-phosphate hydrolase SacC (GH32 family)
VLDIGERDFRDPKVCRHEPTRQWIMTAAWPVERKVRFYASPDLKHWAHLSDFGPAGATQGVWECPDLFPLPIDGETNQTRWVLIVNVNPGAPAGGSGCQYFVGRFDGQRFLLDSTYPQTLSNPTAAPAGKVLADFEGPTYGDWKTTGTAFGSGPAHPGGDITGYLGHGIADSFGSGDADQGTLTSPEFTIDDDWLSFLIGGGNHPEGTGIHLLVGGKVVRSTTGNNSPSLEWKSWDVREFRGQRARVEIFDRYVGGDWGHLFIDHLVLGSAPAGTAANTALWVDYGRDFYAAVTWSDVPATDGRRIALGWMNNWDYGQDVPTAPWRSAMTVPRTLTLRRTPQGLRLFQQPVAELTRLRDGAPLAFPGGSFDQAAAWLAGLTNLPPLLEVDLVLTGVSDKTPFAVTLQTGAHEQTVIDCDPASAELRVDRTRSGRVDFHAGFAGVHRAPLAAAQGRCHLHFFLDTSSLELFAQDGACAMTELIFPSGQSRLVGLRASGGAKPTVNRLQVYRLQSVWGAQSLQGKGQL